MFPPDRTIATGPRPLPIRPPRSAATPTAPAPSTTSFARSSRSTIASLISSSVTATTSSQTDWRMRDVSSPGAFTAIPSAIVKPGPSGSVPDAWTPTTRTPGRTALTASAVPAHKPPPPIPPTTVSPPPAAPKGPDDRLDVAGLLDQLEPDRALARDHRLVLERVHERRACIGGVLP